MRHGQEKSSSQKEECQQKKASSEKETRRKKEACEEKSHIEKARAGQEEAGEIGKKEVTIAPHRWRRVPHARNSQP